MNNGKDCWVGQQLTCTQVDLTGHGLLHPALALALALQLALQLALTRFSGWPGWAQLGCSKLHDNILTILTSYFFFLTPYYSFTKQVDPPGHGWAAQNCTMIFLMIIIMVPILLFRLTRLGTVGLLTATCTIAVSASKVDQHKVAIHPTCLFQRTKCCLLNRT